MPSYALSLAVMSLHVNPSEIIINAGHSVTLPASDGRKIIIPVDKDCRAYIPYTGDWESTGKHITLEKFASCARDEDEYWNLYDMIDGKILLFSDLSTSKK